MTAFCGGWIFIVLLTLILDSILTAVGFVQTVWPEFVPSEHRGTFLFSLEMMYCTFRAWSNPTELKLPLTSVVRAVVRMTLLSCHADRGRFSPQPWLGNSVSVSCDTLLEAYPQEAAPRNEGERDVLKTVLHSLGFSWSCLLAGGL